MAEPTHGLYINGHGKTISDTFCFLPPLFTEIAFGENYGRLLRNMQCKHSKQPVFAMINDINVNLIGLINMLLSDNTLAIGFPEISHSGVAIVSKASRPDVSWSLKLKTDNIFDFFTEEDEKTRDMAIILRWLNMRVNSETGDITATAKFPYGLYNLNSDELKVDKLTKLMDVRHKSIGDISPKHIQEAGDFLDANPGHNTYEAAPYMNAVKRSLYIGLVNEKFLEAVGIKPENIIADIYKYLSSDYLAEHADKLLVQKVLHVDVGQKTTPRFLDYLHANKYVSGITGILYHLKGRLIEARLKEPYVRAPFKLWASMCRSLESTNDRRTVYQTIESVFESRENKPKSLKQFANNNTRELQPVETEKFRGLLSPHIVITNILYPCFLYCMDPESCDILPEFTDEIRQLFEYMVASLPLYALNKVKVLRFIELVTPTVVDSMVTSVIWSSVNPDDEVMNTYSRLFTAAFNTLNSAPYYYKLEDIILTYGVVVYNMPTYIDLSAAIYRSPENIHPREYRRSSHADTQEVNLQESVGSIWNLPNNNLQTKGHDDNAWLEPVMSKKLSRRINKQSKRSKKALNTATRESSKRELSGDDLVRVASEVLANGKFHCLIQSVHRNPPKAINRLFEMAMRFDV
jgi:hypothetical protein